MLFKIDGYEIDIKAHNKYETRNNKQSTLDFLNWISLLAGEASKQYELNGCTAIAKNAKKTCDDIFLQLEKLGFYGKGSK